MERTTEDMESLEMHSAVRNVMRLFDRIKDFEKRVARREGRRSAEPTSRRSIDALGVLAQMLGPFAPHMAEELWLALGHEEHGAQTPWPGVSFEVASMSTQTADSPRSGTRQRTRSCATGLACHRCDNHYPLE